MKKIILLAMAIGFLITGCAYTKWERCDGVKITYSNFMADHRYCYFSNQVRPGLKFIPIFGDVYGLTIQQQEQVRYENCLEEKGYYKKINY